MKRVLIVQPHGYVTDAEYDRVKQNSVEKLQGLGYEIINETKNHEWYTFENMNDLRINNQNLCQLAKTLEAMSTCTHAYFCYGWDRTDHGRHVHEFARKFNVKRIYEGGEL